MTRPNVTPWYRVGQRYQRSIRAPYHDLEVYPAEDGWRWTVSRIHAPTGRFRAVDSGVAASQTLAQSAAMAAVCFD